MGHLPGRSGRHDDICRSADLPSGKRGERYIAVRTHTARCKRRDSRLQPLRVPGCGGPNGRVLMILPHGAS
ncbi:hypothetical protein RGUI_1099 [Rhodovulum sp. P5]|nr:hypothetical protein RGUI_1099 [Rhodovulum sp. P5]